MGDGVMGDGVMGDGWRRGDATKSLTVILRIEFFSSDLATQIQGLTDILQN
jgi:hypothetical protein